MNLLGRLHPSVSRLSASQLVVNETREHRITVGTARPLQSIPQSILQTKKRLIENSKYSKKEEKLYSTRELRIAVGTARPLQSIKRRELEN